MAWEVYKKSLEWEETGRMPISEPPIPEPAPESPEQSPSPKPATVQRSTKVFEPKFYLRKLPIPRKCTNLSHLLTLRSQGIKNGCSTICGECAQVISRDTLQV